MLGSCADFAEPFDGQGRLSHDDQSDFRSGAVQAATVKAAQVSMFFCIAEMSFDDLSAEFPVRFPVISFHFGPVLVEHFLSLQALNDSSAVRIADTTGSQGASSAVLRRTLET